MALEGGKIGYIDTDQYLASGTGAEDPDGAFRTKVRLYDESGQEIGVYVLGESGKVIPVTAGIAER